MSLYTDSLEDFIFFEKKLILNDRGGYSEKYVPGAPIMASAVKNDSLQARIADKDGVKNIYTIGTTKDIKLMKNDVIQRKSDSKIFLITGDSTDMIPPKISTLNIRVVAAQEWELPR